MKMGYYKVQIAMRDFVSFPKHTVTNVYFAMKDKLSNDVIYDFNWSVLSVHQIPFYKFAWYVLTKPVTNHVDCFEYTESVVIE